MNSPIQIGVFYDHILLRTGIVKVLEDLGYRVAFQCSDEKELFERLAAHQSDIIFVVANVESIDDFETVHSVVFQYPDVSVLALSMRDDDNAIVRLIAKGIKGYLLKDADLAEIKQTIENIGRRGNDYKEPDFSRLVKYIRKFNTQSQCVMEVLLAENEIEFLRFLATEMTYKEIASRMGIKPRAVDSYRNALCEKLKIRTRIGLVIYAIQKGYVNVN